MGIMINVHKTHRQHTGGLEVVEVNGNTVGECLKKMMEKYPKMKDALFDKKGRLLNTVEIYVNKESAYPDELKKKVKDGDNIHIALMLAGG